MSPQNDSAFMRMFLIVLGALVAFTLIIMFTAGEVSEELDTKRAGDSRLMAEVSKRIAPVGTVEVVKADAAPAQPKSGSQVVTEACGACHSSGALGAPKIGDGADWGARLAAQGGIDGLVTSAINGKGSMPPRGGAAGLSDQEIRGAIEHMLSESGVDSAAAAAPAPAASPVAEAAEAASNMMDGMMGAAKDMAAAAMPAAPAGLDLAKGKSIYDSACFVCHATGAAGAPKLGDKAAWAPRIAQGMDALFTTALKGKGAMPAKGGRMDLSDEDVKAAVAYMVGQAE